MEEIPGVQQFDKAWTEKCFIQAVVCVLFPRRCRSSRIRHFPRGIPKLEIHLPLPKPFLLVTAYLGSWCCIYLSHSLFSLGPFTDI